MLHCVDLNSHAVGMDAWVLTALKSIFRVTLFLDQLQNLIVITILAVITIILFDRIIYQ